MDKYATIGIVLGVVYFGLILAAALVVSRKEEHA
jgi:hypothetical protein